MLFVRFAAVSWIETSPDILARVSGETGEVVVSLEKADAVHPGEAFYLWAGGSVMLVRMVSREESGFRIARSSTNVYGI